MKLAFKVRLPRHQFVTEFAVSGAEQETTIVVPVGVLAVTAGEILIVADDMPSPART